jgi:hypothetical protein
MSLLAVPFYNNVNLNKNELQNAVIQTLSSDPGTPSTGQIYFNTNTDKLRIYDGASWLDMPSSGTITNAFTTMTDGSVNAVSSGQDTFKFRSANNLLSVAVQNNDATHGDNLLLTINESNIDHDGLSGFVANEHIDHTSVSIGTQSNSGLIGGGNIASTRNLELDLGNLATAGTIDSTTDLLALYDASAGTTVSATIDTIISAAGGGIGSAYATITDGTTSATASNADTFKLRSANSILSIVVANNDVTHDDNALFTIDETAINHDNLTNFVADEHVAHSSVSINTGTGLTGGGTIASTRTINLADTAVTPNSYGSANSVATFTVDQQGRLTAASSVSISITESQISDLGTYLTDSYTTFSDGSNTSTAVSTDTFKFRSSDSSVNITVGNNDATHGDNVDLTISEANVNHDSLNGYVANEHIDHSTIDVIAGVGLSGGGPIDSDVTLTVDNAVVQLKSEKGANNGYASLDSTGKVPTSQLPDTVIGGVDYKGAWNASTNTPDIGAGTPDKGDYYVVSTGGSTSLGGITDWNENDWAIYNGTAWEKVDNTDSVASVFGRAGTVVAQASDYDANQIDYDNTTSGLTATDTQAAIDEVEGRVDTLESNTANAPSKYSTTTTLGTAQGSVVITHNLGTKAVTFSVTDTSTDTFVYVAAEATTTNTITLRAEGSDFTASVTVIG